GRRRRLAGVGGRLSEHQRKRGGDEQCSDPSRLYLRSNRLSGKVARALATDDLTLVKRVRSGDQRAFKLLVERYQRKIYSVALGMVKDREEALDVSQEAFVKVYKYLDHFKGDASFYTWLYRITVNICIDVIRRRGAGRG